MDINKSLTQVRERMTKAQQDLRIVEEQILFQMDVVNDAETRMLVSETPLAEREFRIARDDYHRLLKQREDTAGEIAELQREQDRLLDRLLGSRV